MLAGKAQTSIRPNNFRKTALGDIKNRVDQTPVLAPHKGGFVKSKPLALKFSDSTETNPTELYDEVISQSVDVEHIWNQHLVLSDEIIEKIAAATFIDEKDELDLPFPMEYPYLEDSFGKLRQWPVPFDVNLPDDSFQICPPWRRTFPKSQTPAAISTMTRPGPVWSAV